VLVVPVPQLLDNYAYLLIAEDGRDCAVVDVADAGPVLEEAAKRKLQITTVLSTHHHFDHVGGNQDLASARAPEGVEVVGYAGDADRIPGLTRGVDDGERFDVCGSSAEAIFIPAHTSGHLAYYFESERTVFTGDTLFAGGCGRLFEGDAAQMMQSLARLAALPDDTLIYCGHEYTQANLEFAAMLEPGNQELARRRQEVAELIAQGRPSVPTTIAIEKATNPFLRCDSEELRVSVVERCGEIAADGTSVFAATRKLKDEF